LQNQEYVKRQIEEKKLEKIHGRMNDAEYRLNRELLETIKQQPNPNSTGGFNNKIF